MADVSVGSSDRPMEQVDAPLTVVGGKRAVIMCSEGKEVGAEDMPIYEYQCEECGCQFEVMQRMTEPLLTTCKKCGGHVRRLISQTSFVLKGSGWYVTDYPSESRKKAMSQEKNGGDSKVTESSKTSTTAEKTSSEAKD